MANDILRESELWWLIGILEGEGYFGYEKWSQRVQLKMTDLDVIVRANAIFTKITGRTAVIHDSPNKTPDENIPYVIAIHGEDARRVMRLIVPHMSFRRKQRIWQALNGHKSKKLKLDVSNIVGLIRQPATSVPKAITYVKRRA